MHLTLPRVLKKNKEAESIEIQNESEGPSPSTMEHGRRKEYHNAKAQR
jgi:hypothetical protein